MLETVGNPVAVNPDRELRREADQRGWQVRDFRRPVRLRNRIASSVRKPNPPIAIAFGVAAVAAVLGWVVLRQKLSPRRTSSAPKRVRAPETTGV